MVRPHYESFTAKRFAKGAEKAHCVACRKICNHPAGIRAALAASPCADREKGRRTLSQQIAETFAGKTRRKLYAALGNKRTRRTRAIGHHCKFDRESSLFGASAMGQNIRRFEFHRCHSGKRPRDRFSFLEC